MIQGVIFDMDGVLFDWAGSFVPMLIQRLFIQSAEEYFWLSMELVRAMDLSL